jgi:hypothetical protein
MFALSDVVFGMGVVIGVVPCAGDGSVVLHTMCVGSFGEES